MMRQVVITKKLLLQVVDEFNRKNSLITWLLTSSVTASIFTLLERFLQSNEIAGLSSEATISFDDFERFLTENNPELAKDNLTAENLNNKTLIHWKISGAKEHNEKLLFQIFDPLYLIFKKLTNKQKRRAALTCRLFNEVTQYSLALQKQNYFLDLSTAPISMAYATNSNFSHKYNRKILLLDNTRFVSDFSPDNKQPGQTPGLWIWDAYTGKSAHILTEYRCFSFDVLSNGDLVATAIHLPTCTQLKADKILLWNYETNTTKILMPTESIADKRVVASANGGFDFEPFIYYPAISRPINIDTTELSVLPHEPPQINHIICGTNAGDVLIYDNQTGQLQGTLQTNQGEIYRIFYLNHNTLIVSAQQGMTSWQFKTTTQQDAHSRKITQETKPVVYSAVIPASVNIFTSQVMQQLITASWTSLEKSSSRTRNDMSATAAAASSLRL